MSCRNMVICSSSSGILHLEMAKLWSERQRTTSSPPTLPLFSAQIVQTNRSRLPGASAVTSPIHSSLDACQPGAERAVSIATTNNRLASLHSPPFTCALRNPENKLVSAHLSLKTSDAITAPRTCKLPLSSRERLL